MEWLARISGNNADLHQLSTLLGTFDPTIVFEDESFVLKSKKLNQLSEPDEVLKVAREIISEINGVGRLANELSQNIVVNGVVRINDDGSKDGFIFLESTISVRSRVTASVTVTSTDGTVVEVRRDNVFEKWLRASVDDEVVKNVFRLISSGLNEWTDLYRVLEVLETDCGSVVNKNWATNLQVRRFKESANRPSVSGDLSRHGKEDRNALPMKNPMSLVEAKDFIEGILRHWINSKANSNPTEPKK